MNQPQPLCVSLDFQGYLVCQIPADALEVELKMKTKWGKFTLHTGQFTRTEKYIEHGGRPIDARYTEEGGNT